VGIGITNLIFTFAGLWLIDRLGHRVVVYIGSLGYIALLGLMAWRFPTDIWVIYRLQFCIYRYPCHTTGSSDLGFH
jgi:MFS transporter, SP family, arabinose:H+ symporter